MSDPQAPAVLLQPIPPEWAEAARDARALCESEARKWEHHSPTTAEHWHAVATRLGAIFLTQDHLGAEATVAQLRLDLEALQQERDRLDLKWAAASLFIRDVLFACDKEQPPSEGTVDLPALALEVLGQIETWKCESEEQHANCLVENELRETSEATRAQLRAALEGVIGYASGYADVLTYPLSKERYAAYQAALKAADEALADLSRPKE